jgi:hypothetical protein
MKRMTKHVQPDKGQAKLTIGNGYNVLGIGNELQKPKASNFSLRTYLEYQDPRPQPVFCIDFRIKNITLDH